MPRPTPRFVLYSLTSFIARTAVAVPWSWYALLLLLAGYVPPPSGLQAACSRPGASNMADACSLTSSCMRHMYVYWLINGAICR